MLGKAPLPVKIVAHKFDYVLHMLLLFSATSFLVNFFLWLKVEVVIFC